MEKLEFMQDGENSSASHRSIWVNGPVIVGAGPSGLGTAACLRENGVPFVVLERADCLASLWQNRTYDRLKLHLSKRFCEFPNLPFPDDYPNYPNRRQFIDYIQSYADHFDIHPQFRECVQSAHYDETLGLWRVRTTAATDPADVESSPQVEYICRWLVVATGENADCVVPQIEGLRDFKGEVLHVADYKSGEKFSGKRVLVVGCGNSGMEVSLDLCNHNAHPFMVVRSSVHVLPREVLGKSTFELAAILMNWLPLWMVDKLLLVLAWLFFGNLEKLGIRRPSTGPLELKNKGGKTPVLDIGALGKIRSGSIKVVPAEIKHFVGSNQVEFVNGCRLEFDSVVLATGYKSNVRSWLQETDFFGNNGYPKTPFPNGWKGSRGLYAVGFTRRGLFGAASDAAKIGADIGSLWKQESEQQQEEKTVSSISCHRRCTSHKTILNPIHQSHSVENI
ncbi:hypothetical protein SAY86_005483 [Trapa natans]|uniref:Flavin-containing monooxygenase n=1 Tax=Trapa natans TaxID=22666 RepID=A0AAN7QUV0_TRANT|nr:hypothetical protein SAY86_005483 [Trapa natans]